LSKRATETLVQNVGQNVADTLDRARHRPYAELLRFAANCMPTLVHCSEQVDFSRPGKHHYQIAFHLDGGWGYSLVPLTVINGLNGANKNNVICFGGTHGNEYEGQIAVKKLCTCLNADNMTGRVVLIPQLSESACNANTRVSPLDGVNMNRAFPGQARGSMSFRIAHFVKTQIFPQGRIVIDMHAGGKEGAFPICTSFHPMPDPAQQAETAAIARLYDTPFVFIYASAMASGLLTDEAEAEGKVSLGGEFGGGETTSRWGVRHAYEGTLNVLRHYGMLEGDIQKIRHENAPPPKLVRAVDLKQYVPCPRDGVWEPVVDLGAAVEVNEVIGRLHDFSDHSAPPLEIRTPRAGYVGMMHLSARPLKGQTLYVIADEVDWQEISR
jgi:predicted deacylase